jgi:hypothetical protein
MAEQHVDISSSSSIFHTKTTADVASSTETLQKTTVEYVTLYETSNPKGLESENENGSVVKHDVGKLPASAMSPYHNVRIKTVTGASYPANDEESAKRPWLYKDLTIDDLVNNRRGASAYKYDDFLYLKYVNKVKLNRLITLRRFASPVFDDIFSKSSKGEPDIARLLTFSTQEENKFEDILSFTMGLRWKPMASSSEQANMQGDQNGVSGIMGTVLKFVDPKYGKEALAGSNAVNYDPQHDSNKVYGPVDSIADTHIRNVGLDFDQKISLKFHFEMRSINGINQKAAFIDLLSTIMVMCTNDGKFWGGARYWIGPKPTKYMNMLRGLLQPKSWQDFVDKGTTSLKSWWQSAFGSKESALETLKNIANNALNLALGKLLNTLGRTSIPMMNSLLTGTPIGPWHLTIGNPFNPIMVTGDMIMTSAKVSFGNELGYDDFPTEIILEVELSPGKPKGRAEIESMFNAGKGRTYFKPKQFRLRNKVTSSESNPINASNLQGGLPDDTNDATDYSETDYLRDVTDVWSFVDQNEKSVSSSSSTNSKSEAFLEPVKIKNLTPPPPSFLEPVKIKNLTAPPQPPFLEPVKIQNLAPPPKPTSFLEPVKIKNLEPPPK